MSGIGTGYDLSASTYSPDGRIFQIEYAGKAVENSGTCIGLRAKDGIVLATEKLVTSKLLVSGSNRRIFTIDEHIGLTAAGVLADARHLSVRSKEEAANYRDTFRSPIPAKMIAERVGGYVSAFTRYSSVRPFGLSSILGIYDKKLGPALYMIEPSGVYYGYFGIAVGKGKQVAKTEIEKLNFQELTVQEAVKEAARIINICHDESRDKEFELEMSWICEASDYKHAFVPKELLQEVQNALNEAMDQD